MRMPMPMPLLPAKFRVPRSRRDTLPRPALLARALEHAADARLMLVQAPAGFGKTTLLTQLVAALAGQAGATIVWISLDAEDNDANRLFAALFTALAPLELPWEVPPDTLLAQLQDASPAARTALVPLIHALGARPELRIVLVLDDLHHIADPAALGLLDTLIGRAPPELCVLIGSRTRPPLSLARWRVGGELVELSHEDLQFDLDAAKALCRVRGLKLPSDDALRAALARTHGWAAGLQLMLDRAGEDGAPPVLSGPAAQRHLFDYFAQEVLAALPLPLQDFVLQTSVLPELSPSLCQAVTGRADAARVLANLNGRQLFLSVLDEGQPVLRFHDLFRDFLRGELERRHPGLAPQLHARAAAAEPLPERALPHWLAAARWSEALRDLRRVADGLLAVGGTHRLERWIDQLPSDWREQHAEVALLRGQCAWSRWDWLQAAEHFRRSHQAFEREGAGRDHDRIFALGMLSACHNATGKLQRSQEAVQAAAAARLPPAQQVPFDSLGAWLALARGDVAALAGALGAMADNVALAPEVRYPYIVDMGYGHFVGVSGARPGLERLLAQCRGGSGGEEEVQVPVLRAWLAFWHGTPEPARAALQALLQLQRHLPGAVMLAVGSGHLHSLHLCVQGRRAEALAAAAQIQDSLAAGHRSGWSRTYRHVQARILWCAEDADGLAALLPELAAPRAEGEWPVLDTGAALVLGRHALLCGDLPAARSHLGRAVARQDEGWLPSFMGDARLALADCLLAQGEHAAAAALLDEVLGEVTRDEALGILLLEPSRRLRVLWDAVQSHLRQPAAQQAALRQKLAAWQTPGAAADRALPPAASLADPLSEREREVLALLAEGQSNKLIARALELSLHTVKRHVANILTKLAVDSRTQAAAHWHRRR